MLLHKRVGTEVRSVVYCKCSLRYEHVLVVVKQLWSDEVYMPGFIYCTRNWYGPILTNKQKLATTCTDSCCIKFWKLLYRFDTVNLNIVNSKFNLVQIFPGRGHNGSAFVFCACDCLFESEPIPTSADACGEVTGCDASCQEVNRCSTRGNVHYICLCKSK